eukprot:scaffold47727_cov69-Phaeocystis_antarctica.AAC.1
MGAETVINTGGINSGAPSSPQSPPPLQCRSSTRRVCSKRLSACAGKFCPSKFGIGNDNPSDPAALSDVQKKRTVSFFFSDFSQFEVGLAPAQPHHRPPRFPCAAPGALRAPKATERPPVCAGDLISPMLQQKGPQLCCFCRRSQTN